MSLEKEFESRLEGVKINYRRRLVEYEQEINSLLGRCNTAGDKAESIKKIQFLVHKMKGPSKTLGFEAIGICASSCEAQIERLLAKPNSSLTNSALSNALQALMVCLSHVSAPANSAANTADHSGQAFKSVNRASNRS